MRIQIDKIKKYKMEDLTQHGRESAVMVPLIPDPQDETGDSILFEVRANGIRQGGEICFPGGMVEAGETGEEAAAREVREELLLEENAVEILASLVEQEGPSGRLVKSYIGIIPDYKMTYSEDEVSRVFTLPLSWLLKEEGKKVNVTYSMDQNDDFPYDLIPAGRDYPFSKYKRSFYFYETKEGVIWGITGEILHEFIEYIKNSNS